jgi:hypothetical protein
MARFGNYTPTKDGLLAANGTASVGPFVAEGSDRVKGTIFSDQAGTLSIDQSFDGQNWDLQTTYAITANAGRGFSEELVAPNVRVRFTNGSGTTAATVRLYANFSSAGAR